MTIKELTEILADFPDTMDIRIQSAEMEVCLSKAEEQCPDSMDLNDNYILLS